MEEDIKHLQEVGEKRQLPDFEYLADSLIKKWMQHDSAQMPRLFKEICNNLSSYDLQPREQRIQLLHSYASKALFDLHQPLSISDQFRFLDFLTYANRQRGWAKKADFSKERNLVAEKWISNWAQLNARINPNFNFNDAPDMNVVTPESSGMPAGVSPDSIKDSLLREQYEAAIEANRQKTEEYNYQAQLHKLHASYLPKIKELLIESYKFPPRNLSELQAMFSKYQTEQSIQNEILEALNKGN